MKQHTKAEMVIGYILFFGILLVIFTIAAGLLSAVGIHPFFSIPAALAITFGVFISITKKR